MPPIAPPSSLTTPCVIDKPPADLSKPALVKAWDSQTINIGNCNNKVTGLREWIENAMRVLGVNNDK